MNPARAENLIQFNPSHSILWLGVQAARQRDRVCSSLSLVAASDCLRRVPIDATCSLDLCFPVKHQVDAGRFATFTEGTRRSLLSGLLAIKREDHLTNDFDHLVLELLRGETKDAECQLGAMPFMSREKVIWINRSRVSSSLVCKANCEFSSWSDWLAADWPLAKWNCLSRLSYRRASKLAHLRWLLLRAK